VLSIVVLWFRCQFLALGSIRGLARSGWVLFGASWLWLCCIDWVGCCLMFCGYVHPGFGVDVVLWVSKGASLLVLLLPLLLLGGCVVLVVWMSEGSRWYCVCCVCSAWSCTRFVDMFTWFACLGSVFLSASSMLGLLGVRACGSSVVVFAFGVLPLVVVVSWFPWVLHLLLLVSFSAFLLALLVLWFWFFCSCL